MLEDEAKLLSSWMATLQPGEISPLVNLGSSSRDYRTNRQPHIERELFAPLRAVGVEVINVDIKEVEGVDIAGDIFDPVTQEKIRERKPGAIMCCNMLEHVADRDSLAKVINELMADGAFLFVTVPLSYPYHPDPIDTGFRPSPSELSKLFPGLHAVRSQIICGCTFLTATFREREPAWAVAHLGLDMMKALLLWRKGPDKWKAYLHRYFWFFRPYKVSAVMMRKPSG